MAVVVFEDTLPGLSALPPPPPGGEVPSGATIMLNDAAIPGLTGKFRYELGGVDITGLVHTAQWRHGSQLTNRVGGMLQEAACVLTLRDEQGWFNVFNPAPMVDPYPGATLRIEDQNGNRMFEGWSAGVQNASPLTETDLSVLVGYGPLTRLNDIEEGLFVKLTDNTTPDGALDAALDDLGWPDHLRQLQASDLLLNYIQLNLRGALSAGRRKARFGDVAHLMGVLDGGRVFDDRIGNVVFENFSSRHAVTRPIKTLPAPFDVQTEDMDRLVVNIVEETAQSLLSQGRQDVEFDIPLPARMVIPPNTLGGVTLTVANDKIRQVDWEPLVKGVHYTWPLTTVPDVRHNPTSITILFNNVAPHPVTATIIKVEGEPFAPRWRQDLVERNEASITRYGPKAVTYPDNLVVHPSQARARANFWVNDVWGGIGPMGQAAPPIPLSVKIREPEDIYDISDLVLMTWQTPSTVHAQNWPFWVDAVQHTVDSEGVHDVELTMQSALPPWAARFTGEPDPPPVHFAERLVGKVMIPDVLIPGEEQLVGKVRVQELVGRVIITGDDFCLFAVGEALVGRVPIM